MILSMTGYGDAQYSDGEISYSLAVKTLNNRYFKASIKLPEHLAMFEAEVEKMLRARLSRGTVHYTLRIGTDSADAAQQINTAALQSLLAQLGKLPNMENARLDLGSILALPGFCQPPQIDEERRAGIWKIIERMTGQALDRLIEMRGIEGRALRDDLLGQNRQIREHLRAVVERAPLVLQDYQQRLLQRVNELIGEGRLPLALDDLKREVALYAERSDINEEVARLSSHLEQFERLCDSREPAGRTLDFLAQELLREANTIASKASDATIAQHIVEIKGSIDRLKEQVQNIV